MDPTAASRLGARGLTYAARAASAALLLITVAACQLATGRAGVAAATPVRAQAVATPYEVVARYPHDPLAFTQGLVWSDGGFYESTGLFGRSSLRRVAFPSGDVLQQVDLPAEDFGEGLSQAGDRLVQLTWQNKRGYVYDRASLGWIGQFGYPNEGWGLTYDGTSLIQSDGSSTLTFLDPETYQPVRTLNVTMNGRPVPRLNELEWIEGEIWANVWLTDQIVRIDPQSGEVASYLDLTGLLPAAFRTDSNAVLNGIAYDPEMRRIFVGGKLWPYLFELRI